MIYVIMGKSCSGKTTFAKELERYGIERIKTCTTRPKRRGDSDEDYYFISDEAFDCLASNGYFLETRSYNTVEGVWKYASIKSEYETEDVKTIILTPEGLEALKNTGIKYKTIYMDPPDVIRIDRAIKRGDDYKEMMRRSKTDREDFEDITYDYVIRDSKDKYPVINNILLRKSMVKGA